MALSDIVNVSITTETAKVTQAGFGVPLILAADTPVGFTERTRSYTELSGLGVDFATTTATYKQASAIFSQNPRPPTVMVGRLANIPTQRFAITPVASNSTVYELRVNGTLVSFTSDASATVTEIIAGLTSAINALSLGITCSDQTTYLRVIANTAGAFFSIESLDVTKLAIAQDHADPGLAADLGAIFLENSTWYALLFAFNSKACVEAIATWAEANKKLFIAQTQDSAVITLADGSDTGGSQTVAGSLKASARFRTALIYHPSTMAFADGGLAGRCLPLDPGSETWAFKTLAGVSSVTMTATHRTNALAKYVNIVETIAGVSVTEEGKVSANEFIDIIRFRDWLEARISENVFGALVRNKKVPFTDGGIAIVKGLILAVLQDGVDVGGLASDPAPTVTVPKAANVSSNDKAARRLTGVKFDAVLAGAIQAVTISGTVSV